MKLRMLELFSGSRVMAAAFRQRLFETTTMDNNDELAPDVVADILDLNVADFIKKHGHFDVIWASPPCTAFSPASLGHHWGGGKKAYIPKTETAKRGMAMIKKTVELIEANGPCIWFIENPRGVMRNVEPMKEYIDLRNTVCYCRYGETHMKPTDVWTNSEEWAPGPEKMCKNGGDGLWTDENGVVWVMIDGEPCHESAPRGSSTGTQGLKDNFERSKIPRELCRDIADACRAEVLQQRRTGR